MGDFGMEVNLLPPTSTPGFTFRTYRIPPEEVVSVYPLYKTYRRNPSKVA